MPRELRVLVLAESLPYPTLKGGDFRTWQNVNVLAGFSRVSVFGLCSNDVRKETPPKIDLDGWSCATDPALAIPPPTGVRLPARAWLFDPSGHPSDLYFTEAAAAELGGLLVSFRPHVVVVEGVWLHSYIEVARTAGCRVILDCPDVEAEISRQMARTVEGSDLEARVRRDVLPARTEAIERGAVGRADQVWVCSREDEGRLRRLYDPAVPVVVVPNCLRAADYEGVRVARRERPRDGVLSLVFPGFFAYAPNARAARFLIGELGPLLDEAGAEWTLALVGALPPAELSVAAAQDERVVVTGAVRSVHPWLVTATVMPVALFEGSGTRLKVLEAFAAEVPVVTTAKGVEGLGVVDGTHALIAETAPEFAAATLRLWRDPALRRRLTRAAFGLLEERYSWTSIDGRIRRAVESVLVA
jgi:glycosyltransferase involved in cell wall biosynthesis